MPRLLPLPARALPALPLLSLLLLASLAAPGEARAGCYIHFDAEANRVMHMGGNVDRGNFASAADCQNYQNSRPGFERNHSHCVCSGGSGSSGHSGGGYASNNPAVNLFGAMLQGLVQGMLSGGSGGGGGGDSGPSAAALAAQKARQEAEAARQAALWEKARQQMTAMEQEYNALSAQAFEKEKAGLAKSLKDRFNAMNGPGSGSGAVGRAENSACWSRLAEQAAKGKNPEQAREYAQNAELAMSGSGPACPGAGAAGAAPAVPAPAYVSDFSERLKDFMSEEKKLLEPMVVELKQRATASAQAEEQQRQVVEDLSRKQEQAADPQAKQEADALLAEARKALAEAKEEKRTSAEELQDAEQRLKGLELMVKASTAQAKPASGAKAPQ